MNKSLCGTCENARYEAIFKAGMKRGFSLGLIAGWLVYCAFPKVYEFFIGHLSH